MMVFIMCGLVAVSTPISKKPDEDVPNEQYKDEYYAQLLELQQEEDEKEESSDKILHRLRMRSHLKDDIDGTKYSQTPQRPWSYLQDLKMQQVSRIPNTCVKPILKQTDAELYIHDNIEWNMDKKFYRDPVVNQKTLDMRKEHIQKVIQEHSQSRLLPI